LGPWWRLGAVPISRALNWPIPVARPWLDVQNEFVCRRLAADSRKINLHDDDDRLDLHIKLFSAMGFDLGAIHAADQHSGAITPHLARLADDWLHAAAQIASADVENDFQAWKG
jgi:hypothetical protein